MPARRHRPCFSRRGATIPPKACGRSASRSAARRRAAAIIAAGSRGTPEEAHRRFLHRATQLGRRIGFPGSSAGNRGLRTISPNASKRGRASLLACRTARIVLLDAGQRYDEKTSPKCSARFVFAGTKDSLIVGGPDGLIRPGSAPGAAAFGPQPGLTCSCARCVQIYRASARRPPYHRLTGQAGWSSFGRKCRDIAKVVI